MSNNYLRIIHRINLTEIKQTVNNFEQAIHNNTSNNPLFSVIEIKLSKLDLALKRISPPIRIRRWESLGRAWKYISGSPDAEDLKIINSTFNKLINENSKQININSILEMRIRNVTNTFNSLIDNEQNLEYELSQTLDILNLIFKIDQLAHYLEIIEEAVTLARRSIPSSRIIHLEELEFIQHTLSENGFAFSSVDDLLNIASAYVMLDTDVLVYVLKIPRIKDTHYTFSVIEPVIKNNYRIHLPAKYYLRGRNSYVTKTSCAKSKGTYVCNLSQLEPLTECIQQLVSGGKAACPMERIYSNKTIQRVDDGNIIINTLNTTLLSNCTNSERVLQGSFLIQYANCVVKLDNDEYSNNNKEIKQFIPSTGIKVNPTKLFNQIPLEHLQELHLKHRDHISHLNLTTENIHWKLNIFGWMSSLFSSVLLIIIIAITIIIILKFTPKKPIKIKVSRDVSDKTEEATFEPRGIPLIPQKPPSEENRGRLSE